MILEKIDLHETATATRQSCHGLKFCYDPSKYCFKEALEELFGIPLTDLHLWLGQFETFERKNDQLTFAHRVYYSNFDRMIKPIYKKFIDQFLRSIIAFPFAYQKIPTFRIGLPGNRFVGEYHTDTKYNHPDFELNFNLGLSNYKKPCCLMSEEIPKSKNFLPIECDYGQIFSFNHIDCVHGSEINTTNETMVSIDFRLAMMPFYTTTSNPPSSVNMGTSFVINDYFSGIVN